MLQMSEYQIVKFRAIDRPLNDKQLEFMDRQSSRAEFTKWEFEVEYHYGSFRGDVDKMLQNGYDVFLTYSNYDGREVRMRLPHGLPFPESVWSKYICSQDIKWTRDKTGEAGILSIAPVLDESDESIWEYDDYLDAVAKLRDMLIAGDLRALFVVWLCGAMASYGDIDESMEPPVPHGLGTFPEDAANLLAFFEVDPYLVDAAAIGIPSYNANLSQESSVRAWIESVPDARRSEIIQRILSEDPVALKAELLSEIRTDLEAVEWPVEQPTRMMAQLLEKSVTLREKAAAKQKLQEAAKATREAKKAEKQRQARMVEMKSDPDAWLKKASQLVEQRGTNSYTDAASILADLRDAVGGEQGKKKNRQQPRRTPCH